MNEVYIPANNYKCFNVEGSFAPPIGCEYLLDLFVPLQI